MNKYIIPLAKINKTQSVEEVFNRIKSSIKNLDRSKSRTNLTVEATDFVKTQVSKDILKYLFVPKTGILSAANAILNLYPQDCKQCLYKFSKIIPMNNHSWNLRCPIVKITPFNKKYLISDYKIRCKNEIPYFKRYFSKNSPVKGMVGKKIDVIVYTKKQLIKEGIKIKSDYGIVAINVEMDKSAPILPQTMINNHLGIKYGGNGEKLDKKKYLESVEFWKTHAFLEK